MNRTAIRRNVGCILFLLLIGLPVGCSSANKPTDQNFIKALNANYENHYDCSTTDIHDWASFPFRANS